MLPTNYNYAEKLREDRSQMLDRIKESTSEQEALELLNEYRSMELEIPGYKKSLEILSDTTYQDRKHFLLELIQNADDASFGVDYPSLKFIIYSDRMELQYNEYGFKLDDILSITDTGSSTKTGVKRKTNSFIGEKGIGFKSVFALAESVEIHSRMWHFCLMKDQCIIPHPLYSENTKEVQGTKLVIRFIDAARHGDSIDIIWNELHKYVNTEIETFLFLQQLSIFILEDRRSKEIKCFKLEINPFDRSTNQLQITTEPINQKKDYILYKEKVSFPSALVEYRWEKIGRELGDMDRLFTVAVKSSNGSIRSKNGKLFCFLPTIVALPMPIFLQVDGHTKADRESLHDPINNAWNRHLLDRLPNFLRNAIMHFTTIPEISNELINIVPDNAGNGQLSDVFRKLIHKLHETPWVKTNNPNEWVEPRMAIVQSNYFNNLFNFYPEYRIAVEKHLGKKFICKEWINNSEDINKLTNVYYISSLTELQESQIIQFVGVPEEILENQESLEILYTHIAGYSEFAVRYWSNVKELITNICKAPIFPIEGEGFAALKRNDKDENIYWLSTASKRETGLGTSSSEARHYRIVDPSYTYNANESGSKSNDLKAKNERVNGMNRSLKRLLELLKIREMKDETLLSEVQIPFLLLEDSTIIGQKYKVLMALFKAFRLKKNLDSEYKASLKVIKDAIFISENYTTKKLNQLLIPDILGTTTNEVLFYPLLKEKFHLPDFITYELKTEESKNRFKQFLIYCGIRNGPEIQMVIHQYSNMYDFKNNAASTYELWKCEVRDEYTSGRPIETEQYVLDEFSQKLMETQEYDAYQFSKNLYNTWKEFYHKHSENVDSRKSLVRTEIGFIKVNYFRREPKTTMFKQNHFCGVRFESVPLINISNSLTFASKSYLIKNVSKTGMDMVCELFDVVLANSVAAGGYELEYLNQLGIEELKLSSLNNKWEELPPDQHCMILHAAKELLAKGVENDGLLILDNSRNVLRSATDFKLGKGNYQNIPMIETQYGEIGLTLGKMLGLMEELGVSSYLGIFKKYFSGSEDVKKSLTNDIYSILKHWREWDLKCRNEIVNDFENTLRELSINYKPIFLMSDFESYRLLNSHNVSLLYLTPDSIDQYELEIAAKEIGFSVFNEIGSVVTSEEVGFEDCDRLIIRNLAEAYLNTLGAREKSKLLLLLSGFGSFENWGRKIKRIQAAKRVFSHKGDSIEFPATVPIYDEKQSLLYVEKTCGYAEALAHLFSECGFILYKYALIDIKQLEKSLKKQQKEIDKDINLTKYSQDSVKALRDDRGIGKEQIVEPWRPSIEPSKLEDFQEQAETIIVDTFESAAIIENKTGNRKQNESLKSNLESRGLKMKIDSPIEGKSFLLDQYRGHCQICGEQIKLHNGNLYFESYHIQESSGDFQTIDMPFNLLAMCPNCYIKAKFGGGRDLSTIMEYAKLHSSGDIFPEEIEDYQGDYYRIPIKINNEEKQLKMSMKHLSYFAAFYENLDEI